MKWTNHCRQDLLSLEREKYGLSKNVHGSSQRSGHGQSFQRTIDVDPTLDTAAKLLTRKMEILKNPNTSHGFKKQAIKQIDPDIELYVKKMRQLPAPLSVDADPTKLVKSLKDEGGDLVTPIQQKLLKRILSKVTPK